MGEYMSFAAAGDHPAKLHCFCHPSCSTVCVTTPRSGSGSTAVPGSFSCDLGAGVSWDRANQVYISIPVVATAFSAVSSVTNRATVTDNLGRNATANASVIATAQIPPNSVSAACGCSQQALLL